MSLSTQPLSMSVLGVMTSPWQTCTGSNVEVHCKIVQHMIFFWHMSIPCALRLDMRKCAPDAHVAVQLIAHAEEDNAAWARAGNQPIQAGSPACASAGASKGSSSEDQGKACAGSMASWLGFVPCTETGWQSLTCPAHCRTMVCQTDCISSAISYPSPVQMQSLAGKHLLAG